MNINTPAVQTVTQEMMWGQNRICNRYRPLVDNPTMAALDEQRRVEVIIMDSGIYHDHAEFANSIIEDLYFIPGFGSTKDDTGHGTAMASVIVGNTLGVNKKAVIKIVKMVGDNYKTTAEDIALAFDAVYDYHLTCPEVPKIVNMCWEVPFDTMVNEKLQKLIDAGLLVIASAGNCPANIDTYSPAGYAGVFTVAASTKLDEEYTQVYGIKKKIDIYAPGESVAVALTTAPNEYSTISGSSVATALTSGVASIVAGLFNSTPSADEIKDAIRKDATPSPLMVNESVSPMENRLLHRPDASGTPIDQGYYGGNITMGSVNSLNIPLFTIMPLQIYQSTFGDISCSVDWTTPEGQEYFGRITTINEYGNISIQTPDEIDFGSEVLKQFSFSVIVKSAGITMKSPMIHFFVTQTNAAGHDISATVDSLKAQSYLIPLTLTQTTNFK